MRGGLEVWLPINRLPVFAATRWVGSLGVITKATQTSIHNQEGADDADDAVVAVVVVVVAVVVDAADHS